MLSAVTGFLAVTLIAIPAAIYLAGSEEPGNWILSAAGATALYAVYLLPLSKMEPIGWALLSIGCGTAHFGAVACGIRFARKRAASREREQVSKLIKEKSEEAERRGAQHSLR